MSSAESPSEAVDQLAATFTGQLLRPADPAYEEARKVHNGPIDKRPAIVARCRGVGDIIDAIRVAREHKLDVAVRGGGHNVAGSSTIDGGLIAYPFEAAWDVLRFYRDLTAALPDEFTVFSGLVHAPDGSGTKLVAIARTREDNDARLLRPRRVIDRVSSLQAVNDRFRTMGIAGRSNRENPQTTDRAVALSRRRGLRGGHNPLLPSSEPSTPYEFKLRLEAIAAGADRTPKGAS